jgi:hypothetical protein
MEEEEYITINEEEEAKFIIEYAQEKYDLKINKWMIDVIIEGQLKYMTSIGLIEEIDEEE